MSEREHLQETDKERRARRRALAARKKRLRKEKQERERRKREEEERKKREAAEKRARRRQMVQETRSMIGKKPSIGQSLKPEGKELSKEERDKVLADIRKRREERRKREQQKKKGKGKSKSKRQVRYLMSEGSPLEERQKSILRRELRSGAVKTR
jgi:hypothetical protein